MLPASSLPVWERGALGYSHFHYVLNWADFLPWTRCTHARTHTQIYMHTQTPTLSPALCFSLSYRCYTQAWNREFQVNSILQFDFILCKYQWMDFFLPVLNHRKGPIDLTVLHTVCFNRIGKKPSPSELQSFHCCFDLCWFISNSVFGFEGKSW